MMEPSKAQAAVGVDLLPIHILNKVLQECKQEHALKILPLISQRWRAALAQPLDIFGVTKLHLPAPAQALTCFENRAAAVRALSLSVKGGKESSVTASMQQLVSILDSINPLQLTRLAVDLNSSLESYGSALGYAMPAILELTNLEVLRILEASSTPRDPACFCGLQTLTHLTELSFTCTLSSDMADLMNQHTLLGLQLQKLQLCCLEQPLLASARPQLTFASTLRELTLENLGYYALPAGVEYLSNLRVLRLTDFMVSYDGLERLTQLTYLSIKCNPPGRPSTLDTVDVFLEAMPELQRLELVNMRLGEVPWAISELACLRHLSLAQNALTSLPNRGAWLDSIEVLTLSDCLYEGLPPLQAPKLKFLDMRRNLRFVPSLRNQQACAARVSRGTKVLLDKSMQIMLQSGRLVEDHRMIRHPRRGLSQGSL